MDCDGRDCATLGEIGVPEVQPRRLKVNRGLSFIGSYVLGMGFTMEPARAQELIDQDPRNKDVLFPYLNGKDLNSRPDRSASRWVINFHDWSIEQAASYEECFNQVERLVKPERAGNNNKHRRNIWWLFAGPAPELYNAIEGLTSVIAITVISKSVIPMLITTGQVLDKALVIFASNDTAMLALLSSAPHYWWVAERSSTLGTTIRYIPTDVFKTFPLPAPSSNLRDLGATLDTYRRELMLERHLGLTDTYNLFSDEECTDADVEELRGIHTAIDYEVAKCYGWTDLVLDHGFYETRQGTRYTVSPVARQEILARLLKLNLSRSNAEGGDQESRSV